MHRVGRMMMGARAHGFAHAVGHPLLHSRRATTPRAGALAVALLIAACQSLPPPPATQSAAPQVRTVARVRFEPATWPSVPAITDADLAGAWPAWLASCRALERVPARREAWSATCASATSINGSDGRAIRAWLAARLDVYRVLADERISDVLGAEPANSNGAADAPANVGGDAGAVAEFTDRGRITGYYEPQLDGSRVATARFSIPLYRPPDDLLTIDLAPLIPELQGRRVRGREVDTPQGKRVVPYYTRAEMTRDRFKGYELIWLADPIAAFFLQVQGSGRVRLADGTIIRVGYADSNGHPYRSIGRWLVEHGELTLEQASMAGIQAWARANPTRVTDLLNQNPSYTFFREIALGDPNAGPLGALNVALTPGYSVAVDPQFIALGTPLLLATQHPSSNAPLARWVQAQDTGGAIRGPLRFDLFWGTGTEAGDSAGRQNHAVRAWVTVPSGTRPEALLGR